MPSRAGSGTGLRVGLPVHLLNDRAVQGFYVRRRGMLMTSLFFEMLFYVGLALAAVSAVLLLIRLFIR